MIWRVCAAIGEALHHLIDWSASRFKKLSKIAFKIARWLPFIIKGYDLWTCKCCGGRYSIKYLRTHAILSCVMNPPYPGERDPCPHQRDDKCDYDGECYKIPGKRLSDPGLIELRAKGVFFIALLMREMARRWGYCVINTSHDSSDATDAAMCKGGFAAVWSRHAFDFKNLGFSFEVKSKSKKPFPSIVLLHEKSRLYKMIREKKPGWMPVIPEVRERLRAAMGGERILKMVDLPIKTIVSFPFGRIFRYG